jgi:hypothetical protein
LSDASYGFLTVWNRGRQQRWLRLKGLVQRLFLAAVPLS